MTDNGFDAWLVAEMAGWARAGLRRHLDTADAARADLCSNDYLGLSRHPRVVEAAVKAARGAGAGGRASRLLAGGSEEHRRLEEEAAEWLGAEATLLFPSGYQANLGLITALASRDDVVLSDRLNHASLIDGCRLSGARIEVFQHADPGHLDHLLSRASGASNRLVVTESVFSMDGDLAPLEELDRVCREHGAWMVVDEAHAAGLLGPDGAGGWAAARRRPGPAGSVVALVVTGGKALGAGGALVAGSRALREHLLNRARTFVFTTAPPPAIPAALRAAIGVVRGSPELREQPRRVARDLAGRLDLPEPAAAIVPIVLGSEERSLRVAEACQARDLDVRAVRPPTVPPGTSRLRVSCHAFNRDDELDRLVAALRETGARPAIAAGSRRSPPGDALSNQRQEGRAEPADAPTVPLVIVGTDTGVGKTVVSSLLVRRARRHGPVRYWKPVQTGADSDTRTVRRLARAAENELLAPLYELPLPASPHEAAADGGIDIDPGRIESALAEHARRCPRLVVELAGGLLVPYTSGYSQADLLSRSRCRVVLVARSGLGTLNHTLLTLEALRRRHLEPEVLFLVGPPHRSNRDTLLRVGRVVHIQELGRLDPLSPETVAAWLDQHRLPDPFPPAVARRA